MAASLAGRLALMFAATAALVSALAGVALSSLQTYELRQHQAKELAGRYEILEAMVVHGGADKWPGLVSKLNSLASADGRLKYRIESENPRFRHQGGFPGDTLFRAERGPFGRAQFGGRTFMTIAGDIPAYADRPAIQLVIAADLAPLERTRLILGVAVLVVSLATVVTVSLLGWLIARRGLAPVDRLSRHARGLNPDYLSLRLPRDAMPAELVGMVTTFNDALERLQQAYLRLSTFNADVAHELRTPLNNLIGQTQVALSLRRPASDLTEVLQSNLEELDRLRSIINQMLFLARADEGALAANLSPASLAAVTRKSAEFLELLFEDVQMTLTIEGDATVAVERALIERAITNLLHNALHHGRKPGRIVVRIEDCGNAVSVGVRNTGAPISAEDLPRLFDRFYRVDPSRQKSGESHGLGLAVVKAIAQMHRGEVFAHSDQGEVIIGFEICPQDGLGLTRKETEPRRRSPVAAAR